MEKDFAELAPFFQLIAEVAELDADQEIQRAGNKLMNLLRTHPRFAMLPDNVWFDVPALPN